MTGRFTQRLNPNWTWHAEGSFFDSKSTSTNRPDGPNQFANGYQGIAFGPVSDRACCPRSRRSPFLPPTRASRRARGLRGLLRYTFLNLGPTTTDADAKTYRAVLELNGEMGSWNVDASAGYTQVSSI